jgi:Fe-S cluster assembly iron-binding protein IscA
VQMVLDEPTQDDETFDRDDVRYIVDKKVLETIRPIHVDFITKNGMSGFVVKSGLAAGGGCGSCSSC